MTPTDAPEAARLKPCPFCGGEATQEISIKDQGGEGSRYMHTSKINHDGCGYAFKPNVNALQLFFAKVPRQELLDDCAKFQRNDWNTRHTPDILKWAEANPDAVKALLIGEAAVIRLKKELTTDYCVVWKAPDNVARICKPHNPNEESR